MKSNKQRTVYFAILSTVILYFGVFSLQVPLQSVLAQNVIIFPFDGGNWPYSGTIGGNLGCRDAVRDMQHLNNHGYDDGIPTTYTNPDGMRVTFPPPRFPEERDHYQPAYRTCWICPTHTSCQSTGFRVTAMSLAGNSNRNASPIIYQGPCPADINVPMTISTVGIGPVTWRGNGHEWHNQMVFTRPGIQSFSQSIHVTHSGQEIIKIQYPNAMSISGTVICTINIMAHK